MIEYQKVRFRLEFVRSVMEAKGKFSEIQMERSVRQVLTRYFEDTVMAPLDQVTIREYCAQSGTPVPRSFHLSKMDILGLCSWQGGISLMIWLTNEQMESVIPRLLTLADRFL